MAEQRLCDANALMDMLEKISETDYGSAFSYEAHGAALELLFDVKQIVNAAPTVNAVVLPCKVGDTVWWMTGRKILKCKVAQLQISKYGIAMMLHTGDTKRGLFDARLIGKNLFLSSEAAATALAERMAGQ